MRYPSRCTVAAALAAAILPASHASAQRPREPVVNANWELADKFGTESLRRINYGTTVQPHWIGKADSMWYSWKDHDGSRFMLVVPALKVRKPLFDHAKLAAQLATLHKKPYDATNLPFTTIVWTKDHKRFRFNHDTGALASRYEWNLAAETLTKLGRPVAADSVVADEEREEGGGGGRGGFGGRGGGDFRNWSPDSSMFVFARDHNLYLVEKGKPDTVQISRDGEKNRSFGARDTTAVNDSTDGQQGGGRGNSRDPRVRANVTWSPDSRAFVIQRQDQRTVKDLYLVNVLANPRPTLSSYSYAMPGESDVPQVELWSWKKGDPLVKPVDIKKWRDERIFNVHWTTGSDKVRLVRRDRPQRNLELVELNLADGAVKTLITESVEDANLEPTQVRYTKTGGDIIWWSERTGWGHYYLYDFNGKYKKPLTEGQWRADQIAEVDTTAGVVYLSGVGREPGENVYYRHTYRVNADGSGFALLDPGNTNHTTTLSPSNKWLVDAGSRVDQAPKTVLRDATGKLVMDLEEADLSGLKALGWKPPTQFIVKAADGVTDIYGNLWKPFDFDSTKKYPIIANVYPGPQTESVNIPFAPGGVPQELAQLGFIVIQIGNRGGNPLRSNAYQTFSYYNLRDYALADKKAGIEQLAARYPWIDLDRVGIYGHSGGGFLTAAAMMTPPYNDFFKVGVSSSGNHDNNIYNQNWSEQYHGLRTIVAGADSAQGAGGRGGRGGAAGRGGAGANGVAGATGGPGANGAAANSARIAGPRTAADTGYADDSLRYSIRVPTNIELAPNLKGNLLLATGDMDNNVHPGNTIRMVNALIKANKRFDFILLPGKPHGYGDMQPYFNRQLMEYFAEHLIGDYYRSGAEIKR
ncbi:MAG: DPP IV N-terminal domain-containing protein [Gemmatimonadaceae bacterium]|nr:DPP IV N-terminal domain-containing protein [Gemmatimonadaceae bacterium]